MKPKVQLQSHLAHCVCSSSSSFYCHVYTRISEDAANAANTAKRCRIKKQRVERFVTGNGEMKRQRKTGNQQEAIKDDSKKELTVTARRQRL